MGKEAGLPKNIRQIGEVRGREKICVEDYVMTYIRKKEQKEEQGYLGVFLGEKCQTEDSEYIFIRGILEVPDEAAAEKKLSGGKEQNKKKQEQKERDCKEQEGKSQDRKDQDREEQTRKEQDREAGNGEKLNTEKLNREEMNRKERNGENVNREEMNGEERNGETLAVRLQRECRNYFPEWEVQGCCVIGTYPTARMERLSEALPESAELLYHLQEQEENLYLMKNGQYQRIRGYFVFYEQNRRMQEYLAEVFGDESVEKESLPDKAIKNFRGKIAEKSERKRSSMLKLASSFFMVAVLVIGAIVVNKMEDIRTVQNLPELTGDTSGYRQIQSAAANSAGEQQTQSAAANSAGEQQIQSAAANSAGEQQIQSAAANSAGGQQVQTAAGDMTGYRSTQSLTAVPDNTVQREVEMTDGDTASETAGISEAVRTSVGQDAAENPGSTDLAGSDSFWEEDPDAVRTSSSVSGTDTSVSVSDDGSPGTADNSAADTDAFSGETDAVENSADSSGEDSAQEAVSMRQTQAAYVIRQGDTLAEICGRYYGSLDHLAEICEANGIEDANMIMPGQKIVLP